MSSFTRGNSTGVPTALLLLIPVLHVLGFCLGYVTESIYPLQAAQALDLAIVGIAGAWSFAKRSRQSDTRDVQTLWIVFVLCGLLCWVIATQQWSDISGGEARIGDYATALAILLITYWTKPDPYRWLNYFGAALAITTITVVLISLMHGRLNIDYTENQLFGLGAQPVLGCLATPALTAWALVLWMRRKSQDSPSMVEWTCCLAGWLAFLAYLVLTERRGPIVAVSAVMALLLGLRAWRNAPRLTALAVGIIIIVLAVYLGYQLIYHEGTGRNERYLLYRVAAEVGWSAFPWGHGPFGLLAADQAGTMNAMLWVARERAGLHAHNELMNAWVEGGVVQVLLVMMLTFLALRRIWRCPDSQLRWPYLAIVMATFVHAMTDNTYGIPLGMAWCGLVMGGILILPQPPSKQVPLPGSIRWLGIGSGTLALFLGWPVFSTAQLTKDTPIPERLQVMQRCRDPLFVYNELGIIVNSPVADAPEKAIAVDIAVERAGWSYFVPRSAVAAAASNGDYPRYVEGLVRIAQRNPFDLEACRSILNAIRQDQSLLAQVPNEIQQRIAVLSGQLSVEISDDQGLTEWHAASLCLASIWFATDHQMLNDRHRNQVVHLLNQFPQIPAICVTAMRVASQSDKSFAFLLLAKKDLVLSGMVSPQTIRSALQLVSTPQQAIVIYPLFREIAAKWCDRLQNNEALQLSHRIREEDRLILLEIVRVWSLARRGGLFDHVG